MMPDLAHVLDPLLTPRNARVVAADAIGECRTPDVAPLSPWPTSSEMVLTTTGRAHRYQGRLGTCKYHWMGRKRGVSERVNGREQQFLLAEFR